MGLLDKLWDDIVAGPAPDTGLGKLRRCHTFSPSSSSSATSNCQTSTGSDALVTRSITILKKCSSHRDGRDGSGNSTPNGASASGLSSPGSSPSVSSWPTSSPRGASRRPDRMKKQQNVPDEFEHAEPRSPTAYDWVIISALDR